MIARRRITSTRIRFNNHPNQQIKEPEREQARLIIRVADQALASRFRRRHEEETSDPLDRARHPRCPFCRPQEDTASTQHGVIPATPQRFRRNYERDLANASRRRPC